MAKLKKREQAAVHAVAERFGATWQDHKPALEVVALKQPSRHRAKTKPRLRFDKVAVGLVERLRAALREVVPDGTTVIVLVTAPIRQDSKTTAVLEDKARALLTKRFKQVDDKATIFGNQVRIRIVRTGAKLAPKLVGFVHNPETDGKLLLGMTSSMLELLRAAKKREPKEAAGARWIVVASEDDSSLADTYRHIYAQLRVPTDFEKVLIAFRDGRVESLE